jgi:tRNA A37 methylthiotransferase MiaB
VNLDAGRFAELDPRVAVFVGTADGVAAEMACADTGSEVLARESTEQAARTRGFVKVQDGCDSSCAYCIIPTVRGPPARGPRRQCSRRCAVGSRRGSRRS